MSRGPTALMRSCCTVLNDLTGKEGSHCAAGLQQDRRVQLWPHRHSATYKGQPVIPCTPLVLRYSLGLTVVDPGYLFCPLVVFWLDSVMDIAYLAFLTTFILTVLPDIYATYF
jgi:hypothetical protein